MNDYTSTIKLKSVTLPPQGRQYGPLSYIFSPHLRASRGVGAPGPEDGGVVNSPHCDADFGGSQNRQKCPKKRHLVLYKLAGFYPDGLTRRSVFKRVGGRGNPQKWPIFGPFLGVNCAKPELIPGGAPRLLTRSPTHNGGRLARWSNRDQSAQRLLHFNHYF